MSITIDEIITVKSNKMLNFQQKFPIYENTIVELSGQFRSVGQKPSRIYFGLHCFDEKGIDIFSETICRTKESLLITSKNTDMQSFSLDKKPETWNNSVHESDNYKKLIGIYYDGNINKHPDYLIPKSLAYKNYDSNNITI